MPTVTIHPPDALAAEQRLLAQAVTDAVGTVTSGVKRDLRTAVVQGGLGQRLANAWRSRLYPKRGTSSSAAGLVFSRAPVLHRVFSEGAVIRSQNGFWLAIPTEHAYRVAGARIGRKHMSPGEIEQALGQRLRFVYRAGRPSLLVADDARITRRTGTVRGRSGTLASTQKRAPVVMFVLVPQVTLRKRFDIDQVVDRWQARFPQVLITRLNSPDATGSS